MTLEFRQLLNQMGFERHEMQPDLVRPKLEEVLSAFDYTPTEKRELFYNYLAHRGNYQSLQNFNANYAYYNRNPQLVAGTLFGIIAEEYGSKCTLADIVPQELYNEASYLPYLGNESRSIHIEVPTSGFGLGNNSHAMQVVTYSHSGIVFDCAQNGYAHIHAASELSIAQNSRNCTVITPGTHYTDGKQQYSLPMVVFETKQTQLGIIQPYTIEQLQVQLQQIVTKIQPYFRLIPHSTYISLEEKTIITRYAGIKEAAESSLFKNFIPNDYTITFKDPEGKVKVECRKGNLVQPSRIKNALRAAGSVIGIAATSILIITDLTATGGVLTASGGTYLLSRIVGDWKNSSQKNGIVTAIIPQAYPFSDTEQSDYQQFLEQIQTTS